MTPRDYNEVNEIDDNRIYTMSEANPTAAVLKMGVPVTIGMMFMVVYNLVDTYFIGQLHDDCQLAATNLAYPVMMVLIAISGIVGNGGASYIARCIGAGDMRKATHTLTIGFELIVISSVIMMLLGLVFINPITDLLGAKEDTFEYTKQYVSIMFWGAPFIMGNYAIGQLMRSEGSTFYSMIGMVAGTVANIVLDPVFIFKLGLEIRGAAIATILGNLLSVIIYLIYYLCRKTMLSPSMLLLRLDGSIIKEIMWVGIPHTLEQFFSTAAIIVNNNLAAMYGSDTVAAMGIANKIMSFGNYIYQGMAAGCQPLFGYNYGAKDYPRLRLLIHSSIKVVTGIEIIIMAAFGVFAPRLIAVFTQSWDVIEIGTQVLRAFIMMLPFVGTVSIVRNVFNAIGKPIHAFSITVIRQLVLYIPFLITFNNLFGFVGLIHAQPVEEAICMVVSVILLKVFLNSSELRLYR